jgi:hypothetical protein
MAERTNKLVHTKPLVHMANTQHTAPTAQLLSCCPPRGQKSLGSGWEPESGKCQLLGTSQAWEGGGRKILIY